MISVSDGLYSNFEKIYVTSLASNEVRDSGVDEIVETFMFFRNEFIQLYRELSRKVYRDWDPGKLADQTPEAVRADMDATMNQAPEKLRMFLVKLGSLFRVLRVFRDDVVVQRVFGSPERKQALLSFINEFDRLKTYDLDVCFSTQYDGIEDNFSGTLQAMFTGARLLVPWMRAIFVVDRHLP